MKWLAPGLYFALLLVAPPRGERGLKFGDCQRDYKAKGVAPPRGERGLKYCSAAWRIVFITVAPPRGERGLKFAGACAVIIPMRVAPPRGERGLKYVHGRRRLIRCGRSPSWGAWIEILMYARARSASRVAPPRGERGLKCPIRYRVSINEKVAPPRGERGLKSHLVVYYQHLQFAAYGCVERHL